MRSSSRKWLFGATLCVFVFVSLQLYHSIDTRNQEQRARHEHDKLELQELELKLKSLEGEIKNNGIAMSEMRQKLRAERLKIKELEEAKAELDPSFSPFFADERKPNEIAGVLQLPKKAEQVRSTFNLLPFLFGTIKERTFLHFLQKHFFNKDLFS
uniref:Uncharacterized protein n=1 Tax=Ascaris lumbricoides TaxID=6252 RepID=A0A0M3IHC7_ASCLU